MKRYVITTYDKSGYSRTNKGSLYLNELRKFTNWQPVWEHDSLLFAIEKVLVTCGANTSRPIRRYAQETLSNMLREQVIVRL